MTGKMYDQRPCRRSGVRTRRYRGVFFVAGAQCAVELDQMADFLFCRIDGNASIRQLAVAFSDQYDIDPLDALADTAEFVTELIGLGFVTMNRAE